MRAHVVVIAAAALASMGCHMGLLGLVMGARYSKGPYEAGAIATELGPGAVRTLACLDVGLAITPEQSLLEMHVGNRCVHAEPFDLEQLVIHATDGSGNDRMVSLVDPRHEIVRLHIGARERGHERIRLSNLYEVDHLCIEVAGVAPDAPEARPSPVCLDRHADGWGPRLL